MPANLVDFHTHLDLYPDFHQVVMECEQECVQTLTVTTTPKAWPHNYEIVTKTHFIRAALGLHPQLVAQRAREIDLWETYLSQTRYVGEVGLDAGPKYYNSFEIQKKIFERILIKCNRAGGKILTIHSVRSVTTVLDMIEKYLSPNQCRVVLHWFTGNKSEARRATDLGCYFSVNQEMLKNEKHRSTVMLIPLDRILTETDGPFCQHNGTHIHPVNTSFVVDSLARTYDFTNQAMRQTILSNLNELEKI